MRKSVIIIKLAGLGAALLLLGLHLIWPQATRPMAEVFWDFCQRLAPAAPEDHGVVVVGIDAASLEALGPWPWPRRETARLVRTLFDNSARVVALDLSFPGTSTPSDDDRRLAAALQTGRSVIGVMPGPDRPEESAWTLAPPGPLPEDLPRLPGVEATQPDIRQAAAGRGQLLLASGPDGVSRGIRAAVAVEGRLLPGLVPEVLRVLAGGDNTGLRTRKGRVIGLTLADGTMIPLDAGGTLRPRFAPSRPDRIVSARDVLSGKVSGRALDGKVLMVGGTAASLGDTKETPLGQRVPGVEVHAQALRGVLGQGLLSRPAHGRVLDLGLALLAGLWVLAAGRRLLGLLGPVLPVPVAWAALQTAGLLVNPWPALVMGGALMAVTAAAPIRRR